MSKTVWNNSYNTVGEYCILKITKDSLKGFSVSIKIDTAVAGLLRLHTWRCSRRGNSITVRSNIDGEHLSIQNFIAGLYKIDYKSRKIYLPIRQSVVTDMRKSAYDNIMNNGNFILPPTLIRVRNGNKYSMAVRITYREDGKIKFKQFTVGRRTREEAFAEAERFIMNKKLENIFK